MSLNTAISTARESLAALDADKVTSLDAELAVEFDEHFTYQELQAHAHAAGRISTEDALVIYAALGEVGSASNGGWAASTDTATKVVVTLAVEKLLSARIAGRT